jgi:hypothetical protein
MMIMRTTKVRFSDGGKGFQGRSPRPTKDQLEARKERAKAVKADKDRRLDTRRKVVLGGALIAAARAHPDVLKMVDALIHHMPEKERKLFDGWSP